MVKLRATHKTLRIVLFCVLGAIVAVAGTVGIIMLTKTLQPNIEPALTTNTKAEVPEGLTPEEAMEDEEEAANTLYYLAYVLDSQECYSATAVNNSGSKSISLGSSETVTTKDYKDGVMISTDITSGLVPSYVQTCYVTGSDGSIIAYRRTGSLSNGEVVWNDNYTETYYYTRSDYITTYGEFSTEMTVYLINSDTIETCSEITDNGDGTYSQTFTFNSGAGNWYQYAMWTNGGLDGVPEFDSIQMTVTFDSSWRVLSISAEDETQVSKWSLPVTTASTTITTFTYGEVNEENYSYYSSYFETAMQYATNGGSTVETDDDNVLSVLMDVFSDALGSDGDQFAVTLDIGGQKYYGYIFLKININASDILNDLDIRLTLSTDEDCDSQDLYVELKSGVVNAYYSSNFALNADISEMSSVISQFSNWISNYSYGTKDGNVQAASVKLTADDSGSFDLNSLLAAIKLTKNDDGTANITLDLEDLYGIDAYVQIDLTVTESTDEEGNTSTVYTFDGAYIGDISYNGNDVELKIDLAPTNTATISRDKSQTAFDLAEATSSLYAILNSTSIQADLDLDGAKLVTLVNSILGETDYADYINLLSSYDISVSAIVDITGITTQASVVITDGNLTVIDLDVYYAYDGSSTYGIAYISINNIMDVECAVKAYCDISDLADGINDIIDLAESLTGTAVAVTEDGGETGTESGTEEETDSSALIVAIINAVLGLDFSECITVTAQNKTITATLNADNVVDSIMSAIIGFNMTLGMDLGEIALEYTYSTDESGNVLAGMLSLDADTLGIGLAVAGSTTAVTEPDSSKYLDLTTAVNSVYALLASESIQLDMKLTGSDLVTLLDDVTGNAYTDYINLIKGYTVDISAVVDITGITTQLSLVITDTGKITVIDADIYYEYDGTSKSYGTAYVSINKLMNVATTDAKVYCDIADLVDSIETIIDYFSNSISLAAEEQTTATSTVALIQSILALDFSEIIGTITTDTNKLTATVNADSLLALLIPNVKLTLGDIALDYSYEEVEGVVQAGELTLELTGISATLKASTTEVTEPDSSKYLDLTTAVNSVYALLASESIQLDMTLTGSDLVTLLDDVTGNAYTDYINLIKGYTVDISAIVDITGITTQLSLVITDTDNVTVIDADIYYAYDGTSDYGIAYVSINKLMNVATDDAKVYCDIADLVDSIETIIDYFSPSAQATADEETTATTVALIQSILALDFSEIIGTITTDTNKLTATVNADSLLALLVPNVKLTLGDIALDYSYEEVEGVVQAGELTLNLKGISATITASDTTVTPGDYTGYLDLTTIVASVYDLLASESILLEMKLTGTDLVTFVTNLVGSSYAEYVALMEGYTADIKAYVDITGITTQLSLVIKDTNNVTLIDADIYYEYDGTSKSYGTAYVSINKLMNVATTDAKAYCDIADLVDSIETIIDYFSPKAQATAEEQEEVNSTVALIQSILALDFSEIIGTITTDTNKLTATVNADSLLALLVPNVKLTLGNIALDYSYETDEQGNATAGELTLNLKGISATITASDTAVTPDDYTGYLDLTTIVASVYDLLASESILLDMKLTGTDLVTFVTNLAGSSYAEYVALMEGYTADIKAYVDITGITTQLSLVITDTDKVTVIDADIYYEYDGTSKSYGTAYVSINKLMNVATDDAKVYCDIADLVDSIETIIDYFSPSAQATADEQEETTATTVALVQSILALDFSEIIGTITTDTNKLTATVNADSLLALLVPNVKLTLGNIALDYSYEEVEGVVQAGELTLELTGISATLKASTTEVTEPDSSKYLDLTTIVASVYDLLASESILLEMKLTGTDLVTLVTNLAGSSYAEYVALMEGYTADIKAYVDITGITTQLSLVITDTDNVTVIDADIYYEYDGTSKSYGTAYVSINKLMNVATDDAKVYCDIADLVDSIETIIDYFSPKAQATAEEQEETTATTVALVQSILALDYSEIIGTITTDTNKLTATVNADSLLALLVPNVKLTLGNIALDYSYEEVEGVVQAGELTLELTGISATLKASTTAVTPDDYTGYLDLTTIVASVYDLLASESIQLEMEIDGAQVVNIVNSATSSKYDTYLSILNDYDISIVANVNLDYMVRANVKITGTNLTVLDADIYYEYDGTSGSYGTAYIKVTTLMNVDCSVKGYCDIKDIASSINDIIKIVNGTTESAVSEDDDDDSDTLSTVALIGKILAIDYTKIVDSITIDASNGITASIDADAIVALFFSNITLGLGDVALDYNYNTDEQGNVTAGELSLGLTGITAVLTASTTAVTEPAGTGTYANLTYLANSIKNATSVAMDIATNGATFEISGAVEVNDSTISVDGCGEVVLLTTAKLDDKGEVVKKDGETVYVTTLKSVAVDVTLAVTNGIYGNDGTTANDITLQVVYLADNYTSTATDPFLYVIINGTGIAVTYSQYTSFTAEMTSVYDTICALLGEETDEEDTGSDSGSGSDSVTITDSDVLAILEFITGAFANKDIMANISGITDLLNNFTITLDEKGDISVVYTNADEETAATLKIAYITTTDGALTLVSDIADLSVNVSAYDSTKDSLAGDLAEALTSDTTTNLSGMIALVYGYVLQCVDDVDIKSVFGSDAYELAITLDGNASGIDALKGVTVDAAVTAGTIDSKNIYTIDADIVVSGFTVKLSMVYYNDYIYININDIGGTQFTDLSVKASTDDVYSLIESVVELIMDEDVLSLVSSLITEESDGTTSGTESGGETGTDTDADNNTEANEALIALTSDEETAETTKSTLEAVLAMLTSILKGNILTVNTGSDTVVVIDIDSLLSPFGIKAGAGKLYIDKVKDDNGNVTGFSAYMSNSSTSVETEEGTETTLNKWLTLTATSATSGKYTKVESTATGSVSGTFYTGSYVDIGFASQLVDDIAKFVKDGIQTTTDEATGEKSVTRVEYTFTGDIEVPITFTYGITISATLKINNVELIIGYTTDGELYIDMYGEIERITATVLGIEAAELSKANNIGISYSSKTGLVTLARGLDSKETVSTTSNDGSGTLFWIMTLDYFIDNLFTENDTDAGTDSPLRWLLQMSSTYWNIIAKAVSGSLSISSGLADAESYYLYNTSSSSNSSMDIFGSGSYIASFIALLADGSSYSYGNTDSLVSMLGLDTYVSSGYYGLSLGTGLLGSSFSPVYIGLTCGTYGIDHLLVYANIAGYVEASVDLQYQASSTETTTKALDYYDVAVGTLENGESDVNWNTGDATVTKDNTDTYYYYKFGSVHIEGGKVKSYSNSYCLVDDYITVSLYEWNEADNCYSSTGDYITLRYGSTVYLYTLDSNGIVKDNETGYAVVYTTDTYLNLTEGEYYGTLNDGYSDDDLPTSVKVYSDTAIYEYVTTSAVYTVNVYNTISNELLYTYNVFGTQDVTELYGDYTLLGNLYSDSACTSAVNTANDVAALAGDETTLNLYGKFIESIVTKNGVVYTFYSGESFTFTPKNSSNPLCSEEDACTIATSEGGYYLITGYTSGYSYGTDEWLVLENIIDGFKVIGIAEDALKGSAITNVVVPENICYIAYEAFNDCTSLANIVFLANTIYLNNNGGRASYPFVGCNSTLNIFCNNYNGLGEGNPSNYYYAFNISSSNTYSYITPDTDWTYLTAPSLQSIDTSSLTGTFTYTADQVLSDVNEVLQSASYGYNSALYASYGVYFYTSTLDTAAIAEALIAKINTYTETTYHYIDGYTVEVAISGYEEEDSYVITVTVKEATPYYKTSVAYATESASTVIGSISYAIDGETAYAEYNGAYYVQEGDVTVTVSPEGSYQLSSAEYNGNVYSGDAITENPDGSYSFTIAYESTADTITLNWAKIEENTITIYSDIAFTYGEYNAKPVSAGENNYTLGAKAAKAGATEDYMLGTLNADDGTGNYYFLGYAYMADTDEDGEGDTLTFTTISTSVFDSQGSTYYAIWGYNEVSELSGSYSGSESDPTSFPTVTGANSETVYKWYTEDGFDSKYITETLSSGVYTYYARMQFTLNITVTHSDSYFFLNGSNTNTSGSYTYTADIYEGDTVSITYDLYSYTYSVVFTKYSTKLIIGITHDGSTSSDNIYAQKSTKNGDRYLYVEGYSGNWSSGIANSSSSSAINSSANCSLNATSATVISDLSISYSVA